MRPVWMIAVVVGGVCLPVYVHGSPSQRDVPILITQVPANAATVSGGESGSLHPLMSAWGDGGRIMVLFPDGSERVLTDQFQSACDPAVSFDAERLLFAGKRQAEDPWNIFEMRLDGTGLRQITRDAGNCRFPGYQSTLYTIVSSEPWYQLTFVSDAAGTLTEDGSAVATHLYSCKLDGSNIRQITYNVSGDTDPFLMGDGRIIYASWQRDQLFRGTLGRVALFGVSIDGADAALFGDTAGKRFKRMPTVTDKGLVVFVESDELRPDGAGQVGYVTFRRPLKSYQAATKPTGGLFHSPARWKDGAVLISHLARSGEGTYAVRWLNARSGRSGLIYDDPEYHDLQAHAVRPIREPDGRSTVGSEEDPNGKLFCLNVYLSDQADPNWMPPGSIKRLRVLEGVPLRASDADQLIPPLKDLPAWRPGSSQHGLPPLVQRRILGIIDVPQDGSFNIQVPANTPIQLQTLDEDGLALRTCNWIWARNHERRGCIGCHEDGESTPENVFVQSVQRESIRLTLPPDRRRTVDFRRDVLPIIEQKCVACHEADGAAPRLDGGQQLVQHSNGQAYFNRAYINLLETEKPDDSQAFRGRYVHPGRARTSPLIWHLIGRNSSRPWDAPFAERECVPIPPESGIQLTNQELQTFVEWVDMGAVWDGIPRAE